MNILIIGPLRGNVERLKGLIDVSNPDLIFVLGPLNLSSPLKLPEKWFYIHGRNENFDTLSESNGINISSKVIKTNNLTFCGLGGIMHPQTVKFTRGEWIKIKGKFSKKYAGYVFADDVESIEVSSRDPEIGRINMFFICDDPTRADIDKLISSINPEYVFFPSERFFKETSGNITYIGIEDATSTGGKYILHI